MTKAVLQFDAPRDRVFGVLADYQRYTEWLPGCRRSAVVSGRGAATDVEIVIDGPRTIEMSLRCDSVPGHAITFRMTKGTGLKGYSGSYRLMDSADRRGAVVVAELHVDAGAFAPAFMVDRMTKKMLDDVGEALRAHLRTLPAAEASAAVPAASGLRTRARRILLVTRDAGALRAWYQGAEPA